METSTVAKVGITGRVGALERLAQGIRRLGASLMQAAEWIEQAAWRRRYPVSIAPVTFAGDEAPRRPIVIYYRVHHPRDTP